MNFLILVVTVFFLVSVVCRADRAGQPSNPGATSAANSPSPSETPGQALMPEFKGPLTENDFPSFCQKIKKHFATSSLPRKIFDAPFRSPKEIQVAPGKKWPLKVAGFKILIPQGEYTRTKPEVARSPPGSEVFLRGTNGLGLFIKVKPKQFVKKDKFFDVSKKQLTVEGYVEEAYKHHLNELKCDKFSDEQVLAMVSLMDKDLDLTAFSEKIQTLKVYKIQNENGRGILRMATGTGSLGKPSFHLVLDQENETQALTILGGTRDQKQIQALAADILNLGSDISSSVPASVSSSVSPSSVSASVSDSALVPPPWLKKLSEDLEKDMK